MNNTLLTILLSCFAAGVILLVGLRLELFRDPRLIWIILGNALREKPPVLVGLGAMLVYLAIFLIFGGEAGRVHLLYGRWIFTITAADILVAALVTPLVGISMGLFVYSTRHLGLVKPGQGGASLAGTLLAVVASFCPWWLPIVSALVGAAGAVVLARYWGILAILSITVLVLSIFYMANALKDAETWPWPA
jgi:hypothetical protein